MAGEVPAALKNLRVVEVADGIAGGYCGRLLALYGAEVIRIDSPDTSPGADQKPAWHYLNRGKKSITLDIGSTTGRNCVDRLAGMADVIVLNRAPATLDALDLTPITLATAAPRAFVATITPFGLTGPYRNYKATDLTLQAWSGLMYAVGDRDGGPLRLGYDAPAYMAGQNAFAAILAALVSGSEVSSRHLDLSIVDAVLAGLNSAHALYSYSQAVTGGVSGKGQPDSAIYRARDGDVFAGFSASEPASLDRLEEVMGCPLPSRDPADVKLALREWIAGLDKQDVMARGQQARLPWSIHNDLATVLDAPHLHERGFFLPARTPNGGEVSYPGAPFRMDLSPVMPAPVPRLGEHTDEVLGDDSASGEGGGQC